LPHKGNINIL